MPRGRGPAGPAPAFPVIDGGENLGYRYMRRRKFCQYALINSLAAGLGASAGPVRTQQSFKMDKLTAGYTLREKDASQICAQCLYFAVPDECMIVEGKVSPYGWCTYYYD